MIKFNIFISGSWKPSSRSSPAPPDTRQIEPSGLEESKLIEKLAMLKGKHCPDDFEKYQIFVKRDGFLCQLREINSPVIRNLERCEEMCTEKERYQRIVQKGVSPYECDIVSGDVSHEMMVKQYARSAADQERPLPHELRSEKIMNQTTCYLLHNVRYFHEKKRINQNFIQIFNGGSRYFTLEMCSIERIS